MELLDRVRCTIRRYALAAPGVRVVAAVSGGSDSVALAHVLARLHETGDLVFTGIAHYNHQLRSVAGDDERFCRELAARLGVRFIADRGDVAAHARAERLSIEAAAHARRHAFLDGARATLEADAVATGHTRDDQAETFLLRLLRGAGSRGLAAMHPRHGATIRPLLECRRADLRAWLEDRGETWREDDSNEDVSIPRNRIRRELLPLLAERFNADVVNVLADAADIAREEWQWLSASAAGERDALCRAADGEWRLTVSDLVRVPTAVSRVLVSQILLDAARGPAIGFRHIQAVLDLAGAAEGAQVDLPGIRAQRVGSEIVLRSKPLRESLPVPFSYVLPVPGAARIAEAGVEVTAHVSAGWAPPSRTGAADIQRGRPEQDVAVQRVSQGSLRVRSWQPGDRFRPLGMSGRKKLQDFFVDRKIPRNIRPRVPIVVDEFDRIVWVAGLGIDEDFRVTEPSQPVLVLRLKPLGGLA